MEENNKNINPNNELSDFILYTAPSGEVRIDIYVENETIWLTQPKMADLFGVDRTVVTKHLKNIYTEGELEKTATSAKFAQVQQNSKN